MIFFKLAAKNLKSNVKRYSVYFFSIIFAITIYFLFMSVRYDPQVASISAHLKVGYGFYFGAQMILIFSALFIWYSNSFFIKSRKNQIGLFEILGIKKYQIIGILILENLIMGILALIISIFLGTVLNKLFLMFLAKFLGAPLKISFSICFPAIISALKFFMILFLVNGLSNAFIVCRYRLIELFQAAKKREKAVKKHSFWAILGALLILGGYIFALQTTARTFVSDMLITLGVVVLGTELFFIFFLPFLLSTLKENKRYYFKKINLVAISNLLFRVKSFGRTLALITILSASTLTAVGVSYSMLYYGALDKKNNYFFDLSYIEAEKEGQAADFRSELLAHNPPKAEYITPVKKVMITYLVPYKKGFRDRSTDALVVSESEYQKSFLLKNLRPDSLKDEAQTLWIGLGNFSLPTYAHVKSLSIENETFYVAKLSDISLHNQLYIDTLVVKDEIYERIEGRNQTLHSFQFEAPLSEKWVRQNLHDKFPTLSVATPKDYDVFDLMNFKIYTLMSGFIGLVFLVSTASILYFKLLIEATEYKKQFEILRNIGLHQREQKKIIQKQLLIVFLSPLIMGTIHSVVAINAFSNMMHINLWPPILFNVISYGLVYMIFYFLTKKQYVKILATSGH